ncbi:KOW motif-containing protein [Ruficoccus sp. ZRK36]|uniref:KOW motif-containing protein n=1 Tax=Ruficoccus sp. ZRK36 TaxID=2866311 RepID=UPI001C72CE03|nr:KOW motif-containing protein [Ruficoccus sp. ZRK36]QYY34563.1 KOW motif-containing protein [Ruficoccus sp. ZRK36]
MNSQKSLLACLEERFYPYVQSLGFVRDSSSCKNVISFRRSVLDKTHIFAIFGNVHKNKRFTLEFAEVPQAGVDWGSKHFSADTILPDHFVLSRGRLLSGAMLAYFGRGGSLLRRIIPQKNNEDSTVDELMSLFPEVQDWWSDKKIGRHIAIFKKVEPPRPPNFSRVETTGISLRKPNLIQKFFAIEVAWTALFLCTALLIAILLAYPAYPQWGHLIVLIPVSAGGGTMVTCLLLHILFRICAKCNGGPFHKGDIVQIIRGKNAGKTGEIYEEWPTRNQVRIAIGLKEWKEADDVYSYVQIIKRKSR